MSASETLVHRGPDDQGVHVDADVALGAFWAERHGPSFPRARPGFAWLALAFGGGGAVVILRPQWFHADLDMGPLSRWAVLPFVAGALTLGIAFWWGLRRGRAAFVTHGGIAGMMLVLVYGIWPYTANFNAIWDVPALTASMERHAGSADVAVYGGRWFAIDYYRGRPLYSIRSLEEFQAYIARADRPLVVTDGRTWRGARTSVGSEVCLIDQRGLGTQSMVIIRAGEQQGSHACGTK